MTSDFWPSVRFSLPRAHNCGRIGRARSLASEACASRSPSQRAGMSISRRISIQKMAESERRSSSCSSVQLYHLDKALDPAQLDKIIYQAGCNYATATTGRLAGASTNLDFDITGFSRYLASSKCLSVLLFWKEAEEYLNMFSQKDRAACAQKIFQRYLKRGAEFEVNLAGVSDATVEGIAAKLAKPPGQRRLRARLASAIRPCRFAGRIRSLISHCSATGR